MKQDDHIIVGIHVRNRIKRVPGIQRILTAFGDCIKTRLGLHELKDKSASGNGVIIIELVGTEKRIVQFCKAVSRLKGVELQVMVFEHD